MLPTISSSWRLLATAPTVASRLSGLQLVRHAGGPAKKAPMSSDGPIEKPQSSGNSFIHERYYEASNKNVPDDQLGRFVKEKFVEKGERIKDQAAIATDAVKDMASDAAESVSNVATKVADKVSHPFAAASSAARKVSDSAGQVMDDVSNAASNAASKAASSATSSEPSSAGLQDKDSALKRMALEEDIYLDRLPPTAAVGEALAADVYPSDSVTPSWSRKESSEAPATQTNKKPSLKNDNIRGYPRP